MINKRLEKLNKLVDYYEDFYNRKKEDILYKYESINEKDIIRMIVGSCWLYNPSLDEDDLNYIESFLEKRVFKNK